MAIKDIYFYIRKGSAGSWYSTSPTWCEYKWGATPFRSRAAAEAELERRKAANSEFYGEVVDGAL